MRGDDDRPAASAASRQPSFRPPGRARRPGANTTALRGGVCLAGAAQLAAHSPRKRAVAGSNPASGSTWAAVGLDGRRGQGAPAGARFDPGAVHQVSSRPTGRGAKNRPLRIRRAPRGGAQANSALPSRTPRLESWCHAVGEVGRYLCGDGRDSTPIGEPRARRRGRSFGTALCAPLGGETHAQGDPLPTSPGSAWRNVSGVSPGRTH